MAEPDRPEEQRTGGRRPGRYRPRPNIRQTTVWYRLAEWEQLQEWAQAAKQPLTHVIRELSLGMLPKARQHVPMIRALGRCGTVLSELAADARARSTPPEAAALEAVLAELLALVRELAQKRHIPGPLQ